MKQIINGKRYDTETAEYIGFDNNMDDVRNFNYFKETLYRKRTGEFFLYGQGNAASKYAESVGQNCWSGGEKIIPLTVENARTWVEEHLDVDTYEKVFGEVSEDAEDTYFSLSLSPELSKKLETASLARGVSKAELIRGFIRGL